MSKRKLLAKIAKVYAMLMEQGPGAMEQEVFKGMVLALEDVMQEIFATDPEIPT